MHRRVAHQHFWIRAIVVLTAALEQSRIRRARNDRRIRQLLRQRVAAGVVAVRVASEDKFDVGQFVTELSDVRLNLGYRIFKSGIEEKVTLGRRDEKGTDATRADVVDVRDYISRGDRRLPTVEEASRRREFRRRRHRL